MNANEWVRPNSAANDDVVGGPARRAIESNPHLTSEQLSALLLGRPTTHHLARLRNSGAVLALLFARRGFLHPAFQFDPDARRIIPEVAKANRLLTSAITLDEAIQWWFTDLDGDGTPVAVVVAGEPARAFERARQVFGRRSAGVPSST